jgi:hypothetical protein
MVLPLFERLDCRGAAGRSVDGYGKPISTAGKKAVCVDYEEWHGTEMNAVLAEGRPNAGAGRSEEICDLRA